jgi:hypothetical protein
LDADPTLASPRLDAPPRCRTGARSGSLWEDAGLVTSKLELSHDGKALNYFEVAEFAFHLSPATVADAAKTLSAKPET